MIFFGVCELEIYIVSGPWVSHRVPRKRLGGYGNRKNSHDAVRETSFFVY